MKTTTVKTSICLSGDVYQYLLGLSEQKALSISAIVRLILTDFYTNKNNSISII